MIKQIKSTKAMQDIQPKMQEIQEKYKNKPEKQQEELMKLLQSEDDPDKKIGKLIDEIDKNKDGEIDYNEFLDMMIMVNDLTAR